MGEKDPTNKTNTIYKTVRPIPHSDLDFNLMTTNTEWGSGFIPDGLREKLSKSYEVRKIIDNKEYLEYESQDLWALLGFYTRDLRLANLSVVYGEVAYCQYYLDLANDFLREDFIEPFLISLSRVATICELSQSKGGFLRRRMNTFTQEHIARDLEPKKKNLMGMNSKEK